MNDIYLPPEIIKHIMIYSHINTIKCNRFNHELIQLIYDNAFWHEKFSFDELAIITPRDNFTEWISEYDLITRSKIEARGILEVTFKYAEVCGLNIRIDISVFKTHEDVNIIPSTLKELIISEKVHGSLPYELLIYGPNNLALYDSDQDYSLEYHDCNNGGQYGDAFDYNILKAIYMSFAQIRDILMRAVYNNKRIRSQNNAEIIYEQYIDITDDETYPLEYYVLKHGTGSNWDWRLSHWNDYFNSISKD